MHLLRLPAIGINAPAKPSKPKKKQKKKLPGLKDLKRGSRILGRLEAELSFFPFAVGPDAQLSVNFLGRDLPKMWEENQVGAR